ncbi:MAG: hypothetical protein ACP5OV_03095 [Acidimicrobiales bacterium]
MAQVTVEDGELLVHLTGLERLEGVRGDLRAPVAAIASVEVVEDAHGAADEIGVKIGTRIPGVVEVATVYAPRAKLLVAVHRDTPRGVRIRFTDSDVDEWIVGCVDPEATRTAIEQARH